MRQRVWLISAAVVVVSLIGLVSSWLDPTIRAPLRPGLDFTGGTQIQLERQCDPACADLKAIAVSNVIRELALPKEGNAPLPQLNAPRVQLLDAGQSLLLRLPTLSAAQGQAVIQAVEPVAGPFKDGGQSVDTIGPSLGRQLLQSSLVSLLVAFAGIAVYISFRYDRRYAFWLWSPWPMTLSLSAASLLGSACSFSWKSTASLPWHCLPLPATP